MVLAYPYFKKGTTYYYVTDYDKDTNRISILSYSSSKHKFLKIYERTVENGRFYLDYRPTREYTYMSDMKYPEE